MNKIKLYSQVLNKDMSVFAHKVSSEKNCIIVDDLGIIYRISLYNDDKNKSAVLKVSGISGVP